MSNKNEINPVTEKSSKNPRESSIKINSTADNKEALNTVLCTQYTVRVSHRWERVYSVSKAQTSNGCLDKRGLLDVGG